MNTVANNELTQPLSNDLKESFLKFVESKRASTPLSKLNKDKDVGEFRIATYNIHYFTDVYESKNTYENILSDIGNINADVIGLQEFILGNKVKINEDVVIDLTAFYDKIEELGYTKTVLCNSVPSWFKSIYGNIVLVSSNVCVQSDDICKDISETIHTFDKSTKTVEVSGSHQGTNETRCYIKINTSYNGKNIYIYTTHLDVASEELRTTQMQYIINDSRKHTGPDDVVFIMGDFNTVDVEDIATNQIYKDNWESNEFIKDNGKVVALLKKEGFTDCHRSNNAEMTAWNNTRVDFIFCNKIITGDFRAEYLYTANSDHLPVILTLTKSTVFGYAQKPKRRKSIRRQRSLKSNRKSIGRRSLLGRSLNRRYKTIGSSLPPPSSPKVV